MLATETPPDKTMRRWYELKIAERAALLLHQTADRKLLHRLATKMQDGTLGKNGPGVDQLRGAEDMQVRIGDEVHNHYEPQPAASQSTPMSGLKKAALTAALLGAGGGIGAAVPFALDALKSTAPVAAPADSDTQYELHIGGGP